MRALALLLALAACGLPSDIVGPVDGGVYAPERCPTPLDDGAKPERCL